MINREKSENAAIFNYAAQCYNHNFMWLSIVPGGHPPSEWLLNQFDFHFGGMDRFSRQWISVRFFPSVRMY